MDAVVTRSTLAVSALGARIELAFSEDVPEDVVARIRRSWSGAAIESVSTGPLSDPGADARIDVEVIGDIERHLETLSTKVTLDALAHNRGRLMMLHAAGVALDDGRVIAFVGPSGRGKTTLSRALAQHYGYVSDETIAFDEQLRVLPYRKPLSVVRPGAPKDQVSPSDAGLRELPDAELTLAAIVMLERDPTATVPEIEHLHFADAAPLLAAQSSYLVEYEGTVCALAALCDRVGGVRLLRYAEADDVPALIDAILAPDPSAASWARRRLVTIDAAGDSSTADAVDFGDAVVAFSDGILRVLAGIAPAVLRAVDESSDFDQVVSAVLDAHDSPPHGDASELVRDVVAELVDAGLVSASVLPASVLSTPHSHAVRLP